jgi:hypothetical protein
MKATFVYINGKRVVDVCGRKWSIQEIDAAYYEECRKDGILNPPPNQWYPMNILGLSNYSVTRRGKFKNNKKQKKEDDDEEPLMKGYTPKGGRKTRYTMTDDSGKKVHPYAALLVAKMFLPPPSNGRYKVKHMNRDYLDCRAENLRWVCDSPDRCPEAEEVKMSAKTIKIKDKQPPEKYTEIASFIKFGIQVSANPKQVSFTPTNITPVPEVNNDVATILQRIKQIDAPKSKTTPYREVELPIPGCFVDFDEEAEAIRMEKSIHHGLTSSEDDEED